MAETLYKPAAVDMPTAGKKLPIIFERWHK